MKYLKNEDKETNYFLGDKAQNQEQQPWYRTK